MNQIHSLQKNLFNLLMDPSLSERRVHPKPPGGFRDPWGLPVWEGVVVLVLMDRIGGANAP